MATELTTDDCDAVIRKIHDALTSARPAGVTYIQDPLGGQMRFEGASQLTAALKEWRELRKQVEFDAERAAMVIARRKPR